MQQGLHGQEKSRKTFHNSHDLDSDCWSKFEIKNNRLISFLSDPPTNPAGTSYSYPGIYFIFLHVINWNKASNGMFGDELNGALKTPRQSSKYFHKIVSDENGGENIWEIFAPRTAAQVIFLSSSFFLSTTSLLKTPNFRIPCPAVHVFCKNMCCFMIFVTHKIICHEMLAFLHHKQKMAAHYLFTLCNFRYP